MSPQTITRLVISAIVVLGFGGVVIVFIMMPSAASAQSNIVSMLLGGMLGGYSSVIKYWFTGNGDQQ